jgi:CheY-like chemotaxis protein
MSQKWILVVDDDEACLDMVSRMLKENGYEVLQATSPGRALELAKNGPHIHLLLTDHMMPEMKGTQLIREIMLLSPQIGCLLMTGGAIEPANSDNCVTVLKKPFSKQDLISTVQATLEQSGNNRFPF